MMMMKRKFFSVHKELASLDLPREAGKSKKEWVSSLSIAMVSKSGYESIFYENMIQFQWKTGCYTDDTLQYSKLQMHFFKHILQLPNEEVESNL